MKISLTLLFAFAICRGAAQQTQDLLQTFDEDWKPAKPKKATYLLRIRQKGDSSFEYTYYNMYGPRIKVESFSDSKATVRSGLWSFYKRSGVLDSSGQYWNNFQQGYWIYLNQRGRIIREKKYDHGVVISDTSYSSAQADKDYELKPGEKESEYPGGSQAWNRFLKDHLVYPDRAVSAEVMGEVRVQFIVDKQGQVDKVEINKSVEYSLDEEALKIVNSSGRWEPASKDGQPLKSYKIQPLKFMLSKG